MLELIHVFHAFQFAVAGYVFSEVLTQQDYILEGYMDLLIDLVNAGYKWVAFPLGYCAKCFTGQITFWTWLSLNFNKYNVDAWETFISHVLIVSFSIFFVIPIKKLLKDD